jgi:hypothetical protein
VPGHSTKLIGGKAELSYLASWIRLSSFMHIYFFQPNVTSYCHAGWDLCKNHEEQRYHSDKHVDLCCVVLFLAVKWKMPWARWSSPFQSRAGLLLINSHERRSCINSHHDDEYSGMD